MAQAEPTPPVVFAGLTAGEQAQVRARARTRALARGEAAFRQEEPAESLYLVESGRLKLTQATESGVEVIVRVAGPGELVAAIAVLDGRDYPFTAVAVEPVTALRWDRHTLRELFRSTPRFQANVLEVVGAHSREALDRFRELATESVAQRLARALLRLLPPEAGGAQAIEGLTQQELADMAGTTLYTVSRTLSDWAGIVQAGRGRVVVLSREKLRDIAGAGTEVPRR